MKIALVLESFDPNRGGLEQWTWQFAQALGAHGCAVEVVCFSSEPRADFPGLKIHLVRAPEKSRITRAAALEQSLRELGADVIHDMGCGWHADIFHPHGGSTIAWREYNLRRFPAWRQIRFWQERRYREQAKIERRQLAGDAFIVAVSPLVARHFHELHGLDPARLAVIENGVDTEKFQPAPIISRTKNETIFLLVAHNLVLKNAATALHALSRLRATGHPARLHIAGSKKSAWAARLAKKLGVADAVEFLGPVENMRELYARADACVHPTWYDPCSLVTLEAWACGLPVITTRCNGAADLMRDGAEGFVLDDPGDSAALAAAMQRLLEPSRRAEMGAAARELALANTFSHNVQQFVCLYKKIVARKSGLQ